MSFASINLCRIDGINTFYNVRIMSAIGEKTFHVHDTVGIGQFMRFRCGERAVPLRADNITRMDNRILQVDSILRTQPVRFGAAKALLDQRIHIKWVPAETAGSIPLDGSVEAAGGYRYFADKYDAVRWITNYLTPILQKAEEYVAKTTIDKKASKEQEYNRESDMYAKEDSEAYGEDFSVPGIPTPNTWWASLTDKERYEIFQTNRRG